MGARTKLNLGYVNGSLLLAGIVAWIMGSWWVFLIALLILLAVNVSAGEIRLRRRREPRERIDRPDQP